MRDRSNAAVPVVAAPAASAVMSAGERTTAGAGMAATRDAGTVTGFVVLEHGGRGAGIEMDAVCAPTATRAAVSTMPGPQYDAAPFTTADDSVTVPPLAGTERSAASVRRPSAADTDARVDADGAGGATDELPVSPVVLASATRRLDRVVSAKVPRAGESDGGSDDDDDDDATPPVDTPCACADDAASVSTRFNAVKADAAVEGLMTAAPAVELAPPRPPRVPFVIIAVALSARVRVASSTKPAVAFIVFSASATTLRILSRVEAESDAVAAVAALALPESGVDDAAADRVLAIDAKAASAAYGFAVTCAGPTLAIAVAASDDRAFGSPLGGAAESVSGTPTSAAPAAPIASTATTRTVTVPDDVAATGRLNRVAVPVTFVSSGYSGNPGHDWGDLRALDAARLLCHVSGRPTLLFVFDTMTPAPKAAVAADETEPSSARTEKESCGVRGVYAAVERDSAAVDTIDVHTLDALALRGAPSASKNTVHGCATPSIASKSHPPSASADERASDDESAVSHAVAATAATAGGSGRAARRDVAALAPTGAAVSLSTSASGLAQLTDASENCVDPETPLVGVVDTMPLTGGTCANMTGACAAAAVPASVCTSVAE